MRAAIVAGLLLVVAGCTDKGAEAEKRYRMVQATGTNGEICDAGKEVADAYLRDGNEAQYKHWHDRSEATCLTAKILGRDLKPGQEVPVEIVEP